MEDIEYLEEYEDFILPKTLNYSQEYPPPTTPIPMDTELLVDKCNTLQNVSDDDPTTTTALITTSNTNKPNFIKIINTEILTRPAQIQTFTNEPAMATPSSQEPLQQPHFSYDRANASFLNRITQNSILQRLDKYKSIATVKPTVQRATVFNLSSIIPPDSATKVRNLSNHDVSGSNRCAVGIEDDSFLDYALEKHVTDDFTLDFNLDTADISDICSDSLNLSDDYNEGVFSLDLLGGGVGTDGKQNKELKRKQTRDDSLQPDLKKSKNGSVLSFTKSLSKSSDKKKSLNSLDKKKSNSNGSKKSKLVVRKNGKKFVFPDRSKFSLKHLNNSNNIEDEIPQSIIRAIPAPAPAPPAIVPLVNNGDEAKKEENVLKTQLPVVLAPVSKTNNVEEIRKELVQQETPRIQVSSMVIASINKINNVDESRKELVQQQITPKTKLTSIIGPLSKTNNIDESRKDLIQQPIIPKTQSPALGALSKINALFGAPQKETVNNNDMSNKMPLENQHNSPGTNNLSNLEKKTEEKDIVIFSSPKIMKRISQPIDSEANNHQQHVTTTPNKSTGFKFSHFSLKSIKPPSKLKLKETITKESLLMDHSGKEDENQSSLTENSEKEDENMKSIPTTPDSVKKDEKKLEENVTTNGKKKQTWESLFEAKDFSIRLGKNAVGKILETMKKSENETTTKLDENNAKEKDDEPIVPTNDAQDSSLVCTTSIVEPSQPKLSVVPPTTPTTVLTENTGTNNKSKKGRKEKTIHPIKSMSTIAESAKKEESISSPIEKPIEKPVEKSSPTQKDNSTKDDRCPPTGQILDSLLAKEPTVIPAAPPICEDSSLTSDLDNNKKPDGRIYPSRKITRQTALKSKSNTQPKPIPVPKASPSSLQIKDPAKEQIKSPIKESTPTLTSPEPALADACIPNQQPAAIPVETKIPAESEIIEPKKELEDETVVLSPFKPATNFLTNDDSFLNRIKLNESPDGNINKYQVGANESNSSKIQIFELPSYIVMKTKIITRKDLETNKTYIPAIIKQQQLDESDNNVVVPESSESPSPVIKTERLEFNSVCERINALLEENANYLKFASGYERLSRMNDVLGDFSLSVEDATCTLKFLQSYLSSYPKDKSIRTRGQQFIPIYDRQKKIIGYRKRTMHVKPSSRSGSVRRMSSKTTSSSIEPPPTVSSNVSLTTMNVKRNVHIVENNINTNIDVTATKIEPDLMDVGESELILPDTSPTKDICIKNEEDLMV